MYVARIRHVDAGFTVVWYIYNGSTEESEITVAI